MSRRPQQKTDQSAIALLAVALRGMEQLLHGVLGMVGELFYYRDFLDQSEEVFVFI